MSLPSKNIIFNFLNNNIRHPTLEPQMSLFADTNNTVPADTEFWNYSDLHNLYGNTYFPIKPDMGQNVWQNLMRPVYDKRRTTPHLTPTDISFYNQHVATIRHDYNLGTTLYKNAPDLQLSRYAFWCMTRPSPYMMFSRTYLISPELDIKPTFQNLYNTSYQFSRIHLRNELSQYEKILGGLLHKYHGDYQLFNHHMTRAFFYGYGARDLKEIHRIPQRSNDPLANYMGSASLYGRTNALRNTVQRFDQNRIHDINILYDILYEELSRMRIQMIQKYNIRPEQDIFQKSVSQVQSELNLAERRFISKYAPIKIR